MAPPRRRVPRAGLTASPRAIKAWPGRWSEGADRRRRRFARSGVEKRNEDGGRRARARPRERSRGAAAHARRAQPPDRRRATDGRGWHPRRARRGAGRGAIALIGEQPGDQEEQGRPFVGPAGRILDRALAEAGIDREATYVTNAVKHFKYVQRGKRRLHQRPTAGEVKHAGG
jgi:uracil-DNA glycosylase